MGDDLLPDDVKALLLRHIDSIAHLEALLLLRANAALAWSTETLSQRLYTPVQETAGILARLCAVLLCGTTRGLRADHCRYRGQESHTWDTRDRCTCTLPHHARQSVTEARLCSRTGDVFRCACLV
jgi:hypothetical protein